MLEGEPGTPEGLTYPGVSPKKDKQGLLKCVLFLQKKRRKGSQDGFFNLLAVVL